MRDAGATAKDDASRQPAMTLRGATVDVDLRRVGRVALGLVVATLVALSIVLFFVGAHKNAQITELRDHGLARDATITGCRGLLGGSGSNPVGYACRGTFSVDGRRYNEAIPGDVYRPAGSIVHVVTDPDHPELVSTAGEVANDRASPRVFVLPGVFFLVDVVLVGVLVLKRRSVGAPRRAARR